MFRKFAGSVGLCQGTKQNKSAGDQTDQIEQKNKWTQVQSESKQTVNNQVEREQDHADLFHAPIVSNKVLLTTKLAGTYSARLNSISAIGVASFLSPR